jgi:hypothetical protein
MVCKTYTRSLPTTTIVGTVTVIACAVVVGITVPLLVKVVTYVVVVVVVLDCVCHWSEQSVQRSI